jgi:transposase
MEESSCPGCRERDRRIAELEARVERLEAKLQQVLGRNSGNSSTPPSANPPGAPAPVVKKATGRKPGGQPGHQAQLRKRLPPEQVTHVRRFVPKNCEHCSTTLPAEAQPGDPAAIWHQVVELPRVLTEVTEYQGHARTCPRCRHVTRAVIPAALRAHGWGPRFTAVVSALTGIYHVSKRDVEAIAETVLGVPMALGSVTAAEQEVSHALAEAHAEVARATEQAPVNYVDETSWKLGKKLIWLWTAVSATCTYFLIHTNRSAAALNTIFRQEFRGIIISDRWVVYKQFAAKQRQLCWAHLIRDFQALYESTGPGRLVGGKALNFVEDLFNLWYCVRDGTLSRGDFQVYVKQNRSWFNNLLTGGVAGGCAKTAALCKNLLATEAALWTFAFVGGVEPTNNAAERALRKAVMWRKRSFGCKSDAGCRFVERILTVSKTLQQQKRQVLDYLVEAITARREDRTSPKLLATG